MSEFSKEVIQGELLKARVEGSQYSHDNAVTLSTNLSFAGAPALTHLGFAAQIALRAIVGWFDLCL